MNRLTNTVSINGYQVSYAYNPTNGWRTNMVDGGGVTAYFYDAMGELTNKVVAYTNGPKPALHYAYSTNGSLSALGSGSANGVTNACAYDLQGWLTNVLANGSFAAGYSYDMAGNRTSRTSSLTILTNQASTFTANDWLANDVYDSNGNTTTSSGNSYQYDALNRLTNVNSGAILIAYDGDGNRVRKTVSGASTYYLVDELNPSGYAQVLEEWTASGGSTNLNRLYNYGMNLINQRVPSTSTNYFIWDGHGSTRMLADIGGNVRNAFAYDAYGTLIASNTTAQTAYLYSGQQFDSDLGFYYNRARYMSQNTGRFWTMDTDEGDNEEPLSLHKYIYCASDPVDKSDLSGNDYFGNTFESSSQIFSQLLGMLGLQSGLPIKTVGDADIDGQLNFVYGKIRTWEKDPGHGPVAKEPWGLYVSMMRGSTVDTIWKGDTESKYLYQYNGTKYPRLQNRTFLNSDLNYIGFGEGYSARGVLGMHGIPSMHAAIREHLWVDYFVRDFTLIPFIGSGKTPSDNTFAGADTGHDWAVGQFWPR